MATFLKTDEWRVDALYPKPFIMESESLASLTFAAALEPVVDQRGPTSAFALLTLQNGGGLFLYDVMCYSWLAHDVKDKVTKFRK